jgi:single-strand DNA-binding protein
MTKNFVEIVGFVGQDPKLSGNAGTSRVRLQVATNERWKDSAGQKRERTEWHTIIFWNRLADAAASLVKKGSHILVTGTLKSRQYEREGVTHTVWEIHARELLLLDPRATTANEETPTPDPTQS